MGNQTIKLNGLEEYSPITAALQEQYNSLHTNISKRRLMYDCLRNGYALEVMGLGGLVDLLARQDFMAMSEAERRARFMALANALTGDVSVSPVAPQPAPPAAKAEFKPEYRTDPGPVDPPAAKSASTATTHTDDDMMTTRVEEPITTSNPGALKLRNTLRKK
ncbi:hypothetical protein N8V28_21480 [Enterobacter hormaechei subsp. hoffmannii]|nr:hypothetical protein [Enterobacter hormaechei subsp. hoffmannii]